MINLVSVFGGLLGIAALGGSLRFNWWRPAKEGIPVLMYHKIGIPEPQSRQKPLWVNPERFNWQMEFLKNQGYMSITFADLASGKLPSKPVLITFDDGYLNQYTDAFPIMQRHGMKGVYYLVADAIGKDNYWHDPKQEPRVALMGLDEIREMRRLGHEFGSHALSHRRLAALPFQEARHEIEGSKKKLEDLLGERMVSFAFPYGNGEDVPELVKTSFDAGYGWVIGIHAGIWDPKKEKSVIKRAYIRGDDWKIDFSLQLRSGRSRV
ncbi:MAG: polysaccharide deacetylase family protein [Elusimicrobia bacterium]|nr:polysaccharide deacetylase family protein [Elusimicrobiota bacterium]